MVVEGAPVVVGTATAVGAGIVASTDAVIDLLTESEPKPIPGPRPGDPGGEDKRRGQSCQRDGAGWVDIGPVDVGNGGRATGITACLDSAYLSSHKGSSTDVKNGIKPAGYDWARKQVGYWGGNTRDVNACHVLGAQLSGSGTNLANLVTCGSDANFYVGKKKPSGSNPGPMDSMLTFEDKVKNQVDSGNTVLYQVTPHYAGSRNVPYKIEMSYIAWNKDGHLIGADHDKTPNLIYTAGSGWKNLGSSIHSGTGQDAGQYGD